MLYPNAVDRRLVQPRRVAPATHGVAASLPPEVAEPVPQQDRSAVLGGSTVPRSTSPRESQSAVTGAAEFVICDHTIEELFRDEKQLVNLAGCQSRRVEAQKAHIALVLLAWVVLQYLRQAPSQTAGEVQEKLTRMVWGQSTGFCASVSDFAEYT